MWARVGRHCNQLVRRRATPLLPPRLAVVPSRFCSLGLDPAAVRPKARPKKKAGPSAPVLGLGAIAIVGVGYAASEEVRSVVDDALAALGNAFEDFNDSSREFFESMGEKIVSKRPEPWLLDLETMKYPDYIPTLVLNLDKVILHLEHDSRQGWHVVKRPYADQFFKEICHYYEVVIFSDEQFPVALDIITKWNLPVTGVLHREFCKKKRNHFVKDLSKLGRKIDKCLIIDHDSAAFQLQPENGVLISPFTGDTSDSELADLIDFLKAAATSNMDLRQYVAKFGGGDRDIGRRYLLHKQEQDSKVEQRRSLGRVFTASQRPGFPMQGKPPGGMGGLNRI